MFVPTADMIRLEIWSLIQTAIVLFLKSRFQRPHEQTRPRKNFIYGPNGEILKSVTINKEDGDPVLSDEGPHRDPPNIGS